jgi:hypothetical protein
VGLAGSWKDQFNLTRDKLIDFAEDSAHFLEQRKALAGIPGLFGLLFKNVQLSGEFLKSLRDHPSVCFPKILLNCRPEWFHVADVENNWMPVENLAFFSLGSPAGCQASTW